mmetsp:Transcript_30892/g.72516  ORF Transcript_30892/g.72516 Transcript_30892/m.72516 type:complete len:121 (-) Transcript_30892:137-499(-)
MTLPTTTTTRTTIPWDHGKWGKQRAKKATREIFAHPPVTNRKHSGQYDESNEPSRWSRLTDSSSNNNNNESANNLDGDGGPCHLFAHNSPWFPSFLKSESLSQGHTLYMALFGVNNAVPQ